MISIISLIKYGERYMINDKCRRFGKEIDPYLKYPPENQRGVKNHGKKRFIEQMTKSLIYFLRSLRSSQPQRFFLLSLLLSFFGSQGREQTGEPLDS